MIYPWLCVVPSNVPLCKIALGCFVCVGFCSSLESIRIRRQLERLYNGLQMASAQQNNRRDGEWNEQQGDACGDGGMLRMRRLTTEEKKVLQKMDFCSKPDYLSLDDPKKVGKNENFQRVRSYKK